MVAADTATDLGCFKRYVLFDCIDTVNSCEEISIQRVYDEGLICSTRQALHQRLSIYCWYRTEHIEKEDYWAIEEFSIQRVYDEGLICSTFDFSRQVWHQGLSIYSWYKESLLVSCADPEIFVRWVQL